MWPNLQRCTAENCHCIDFLHVGFRADVRRYGHLMLLNLIMVTSIAAIVWSTVALILRQNQQEDRCYQSTCTVGRPLWDEHRCYCTTDERPK